MSDENLCIIFKKVTDSPTTPSIVYQTTEKLNDIDFKSCFPTMVKDLNVFCHLIIQL
jgi:hypothetical protein